MAFVLGLDDATDDTFYSSYTGTRPTNLIFVDPTVGASGNGKLTILGGTGPYKTLNEGINAWHALGSGVEAWLLLRKGQDFVISAGQAVGLAAAGVSATQPSILSSYDPTNITSDPTTVVFNPTTGGTRPRICNPASTDCIQFGGALPNGGNNIAFIGVELYCSERDPNNLTVSPVYNSTNAASSGNVGIQTANGFSFFLVEDCKISFFATNAMYFAQQFGHLGSGLHVRRNVIVDQYSGSAGVHCGGITLGGVTTPNFVQNLFDHNGWLTNNDPNTGQQVFNHNLYIQEYLEHSDTTLDYDTTTLSFATIKNNIFAHDGSGGQVRSGGVVDNNLWILNGYNHNIGCPGAADSIVSNNVYLEGVSCTNIPQITGVGTLGGSYHGEALNDGTITFTANLVANVPAATYGYRYDNPGSNITHKNNIAYNWAGANAELETSGSLKAVGSLVAGSGGSGVLPPATYSGQSIYWAVPAVDTGLTTGTYANLTATGGHGTGAKLTLTIAGNNSIGFVPGIESATAVSFGAGDSQGSGYWTGDQLTVTAGGTTWTITVPPYYTEIVSPSTSNHAFVWVSVASGAVTSVNVSAKDSPFYVQPVSWGNIYNSGGGYSVGNVLSLTSADIGGITGATVTVTQVSAITNGGGNTYSGDTSNAALYSDPTRSVGKYYDSVFGGSGHTSTDFLTAARAQYRGNWNSALLAGEANNWIRAGFNMAAYPVVARSAHGKNLKGGF